jgi:hypothetical protein
MRQRLFPSAARLSFTELTKTRRFPPPSHKRFGFVGKVFIYFFWLEFNFWKSKKIIPHFNGLVTYKYITI